MEPIFTITDLQKQSPAVKAAARESMVRLTENGRRAWVFGSEESFEQDVDRAVSEAVALWGMERSEDDLEAGRGGRRERLCPMPVTVPDGARGRSGTTRV